MGGRHILERIMATSFGNLRNRVALTAGTLLLTGGGSAAQAGVFNTPEFVPQGKVGLGLEPVFTLSDGAGVGINARYTQGLTDFLDANAILGTGTGPRRFRVGGNLVFDFVPDMENQPGMGIAAQAIYYRQPNNGLLELTGIPYLHKSFSGGEMGGTIDPFLAVPIGFNFSDGTYNVTWTLAFGAMLKRNEHLGYVAEVGIGLNNAETYLSGGIAYYP
jgi:hypothetical protein